MLNNASRARSEVGRVPRPGTASPRPRATPRQSGSSPPTRQPSLRASAPAPAPHEATPPWRSRACDARRHDSSHVFSRYSARSASTSLATWAASPGWAVSCGSPDDELGSLNPGVRNQLFVAAQRQETQGRPAAGLRGTQNVALPSLFDVQAGQLESVGRGRHGIQSLASWAPTRRIGDEQTRACGGSSTDPTAQLMQLRHAETVSVEHRHDGGIGDVDPDLDDGRRDEHVDFSRDERGHRRGLVRRRGAGHATRLCASRPTARRRAWAATSTTATGGPLAAPSSSSSGSSSRSQIGLGAITADPWAHDESLPTGSHFLANPSPRAGQPRRLLTRRNNCGRDRYPASGQLGQHG